MILLTMVTKVNKKRSAASVLGWETRRKNAAKAKRAAAKKTKR